MQSFGYRITAAKTPLIQHEMGGTGERGRGGTWLRVGESGGSLEKIRPLNLEREKVAFLVKKGRRKDSNGWIHVGQCMLMASEISPKRAGGLSLYGHTGT